MTRPPPPVLRALGPDLSDLGLGPDGPDQRVRPAVDARTPTTPLTDPQTSLRHVMRALLTKCDALLDWSAIARIVWSLHRQDGDVPVHIALAYAPIEAPDNDKQVVTEGKPGLWPDHGHHPSWPSVPILRATPTDLAVIWALAAVADAAYDHDVAPYRNGRARPVDFEPFEATPGLVFAACAHARSEYHRDRMRTPDRYLDAVRRATAAPGTSLDVSDVPGGR